MNTNKKTAGSVSSKTAAFKNIANPNYSPIEKLLPRFNKVRQTGLDSWIASCSGPLHSNGDRNPSLAIRELSDGTLLLRCFSGCDNRDILTAVGLEFHDLYPQTMEHRSPRQRKPFNPYDILKVMAFEATVAAVAAGNLAHGMTLTDIDRTRLMVAASRLSSAVEVANG